MESTGQSDRRPPRRETREDPGEKTPVRPREQPRLKVEPSVLWVLASLLAITALHYATPGTHHWVHHIARRLYYLPIIIAAFGYATIQTVGANAGVLVGVFGTAFLYLLLLFGQRLDRIQKGEYVIWMRNNKREPDSEEVDEWRRENR